MIRPRTDADLNACVQALAEVRVAGGPLVLEVSAAIAFYERHGWRGFASTRARRLNSAGEPALLHHYLSP